MLLGRTAECAILDRAARVRTRRPQPGPGGPRRARHRQDRSARRTLSASRTRLPNRPRCGRSNPSWSSRSPGCTNSARRCSTGSTPPGPAAHRAAARRSAWKPASLRTGSSSRSPCLSLLAEAAEEGPLVCLVDDAHWLDRVSAQTLAFVARRLLAERLALVVAVREGTEHEFDGLSSLFVPGLDRDRRAGAPRFGAHRAVRRSGARANRGRDARKPARAARAHSRPDGDRARGRFRRCRGDAADEPHRGGLRRTSRLSLRGRATSHADGCGRADGRSDLAVARARAARDPCGTRPTRPRTPACSSSARRSPSGIRSFAPPCTGRRRARSGRRCTRRSPTRPIRTSIPTAARGTAPRRRAGPTRTSPLELERSAGRAQARGGLAAAAAFLAARGRPDGEPARRAERALAAALANLHAGAFDTALSSLLGRGGRIARRAPARPRGAVARADRVRLQRRQATRRRFCSRRRSASSRIDARPRARDLPRRVGRGAVRRAPGPGGRTARGLAGREGRAAGAGSRARPICSSTAWRRSSPKDAPLRAGAATGVERLRRRRASGGGELPLGLADDGAVERALGRRDVARDQRPPAARAHARSARSPGSRST